MEWAKIKGINISSKEEAVNSEEVKNRIWEDIEKYNKRFGKVQQVKKIALINDEWLVETGELTPTLKLKRRVIKDKYKNLFEDIYKEEEEEKHFV